MVAAVVISGCATVGRDFSSELGWLKKDVTTQKNVVMVLGKPYAVGSATGSPTWTYGYYAYKLFGDSHHKELKLFWTKGKLVREFSFSSSFPADVGSLGE